VTPQPANDDAHPKRVSDSDTSPTLKQSAIVTARKPRSWRSDVPDMTSEEHRRRGDAVFREMKRKIAAALKKPGD